MLATYLLDTLEYERLHPSTEKALRLGQVSQTIFYYMYVLPLSYAILLMCSLLGRKFDDEFHSFSRNK